MHHGILFDRRLFSSEQPLMNYKYPSWDIIHQLLPTSPDPETANESETLTNTSSSYAMQIIPCVHKKHEL